MQKHHISACALLAVVVLVVFLIRPIYGEMHADDYIKKGPGVTEIKMLSDYFPDLKTTPGDSPVYILDSGKPGATVYIAGGTHPNEPSGILAAVLLIENAVPEQGRLIVVPHANASAITHTDYMEGTPQKFILETPTGKRSFRYGSRATSPTHQWPDPDVYVHASSGQQLSGSEVRNLNRAHPGKPDGNLTERIAYAMTRMIRAENIDMSIDLHEASPEYPVINAIVAHDRAMGIAAVAAMNLQMEGVEIGIEPSPTNLRGLSHREWGDHTETLALLMETANPAQGRIRGVTNEALIVQGKDKMYERVAPLGKLFVPFDANGHPLSERVARHVTALHALIQAYSDERPDKPLILGGVPDYESIKEDLGKYLEP
jgi:Predicted deacylase